MKAATEKTNSTELILNEFFDRATGKYTMEDKLAYFKSHRNENLVHIKDRLTEKKSRRKK